MKPLLALDVDGVVLPYLPHNRPFDDEANCPPGHTYAVAWTFDVWVPDHLTAALPRLAEAYDIVWATDWGEKANSEVSPLVGLPDDLEVLPVGPPGGSFWKLDAVRTRIDEHRPLAWADDRLNAASRRWARERSAPTKLVKPDRWTGLTPRQVTGLLRFAEQLDELS